MGWLSTPHPGRFTLGKDAVPTVLEAGWAPGVDLANVDVYCEKPDETSGSIIQEYLI